METEKKKDNSELIKKLRENGLYKQANALARKDAGEDPYPENRTSDEERGLASYTGEAAIGIPIGGMTAIQNTAGTIDSFADWATDKIDRVTGDVVFYDADDEVKFQAYEKADGLSLFDVGGKKVKYIKGDALQKLKEDNLYEYWQVGDIIDPVLYDKFEAREDGVISSGAGELTAGVSQFLTGWFALAPVKALQVTAGTGKLLQFTQATAKGAIVDFTAFDAHEERLSNLAIDLGIENEVTLYLAADKDDTVLEGKIKNALEGGVLGLSLEATFRTTGQIFKFIRAIKAKRQGNLEEAARLAEEARSEAFKNPADVKLKTSDGETIVVPDAARVASQVDETIDDVARQGDESLETPAATRAANEAVEDSPEQTLNVSLDADKARVGGSRVDPEDASRGVNKNKKKRARNKDFRGDDGKPVKSIKWEESAAAGKRLINKMIKEDGDGIGIINLAKQLSSYKVAIPEWDAFAVSVKMLEEEIWTTYKALSKTPAAQTGDSATIRQLDSLGEALTYVQAANRGTGSQAGRLLAIQKMLKENIPDLDIEMTPDAIFRVLNDQATMGVARKSWKNANKIIEAVNEYWINSLLSGVSTQAINMGSNALIMVMNNVEGFASSGVALARGDMKGASRNFTLAGRQFLGMFKYAKISAKVAGQTLRAGRNILDEESMVNEAVDNIVGEVAIGRGNFDILKGWKDADAVDIAGNAIRIPSRLLMTGDEFFKQLNFRSKAYSFAAEQVYKDGGKNLPAHEFDAAVEELIDEAYAAAVASRKGDILANPIAKKALDAARRNTFTNDLGEQGKAFQRFVGEVPLLRQVVPFIRTPINILKYPLKRAPILNRFSSEMQNAIKQGGAEADRAKAAIAMGYLYWTGAVMAAFQKQTISDGNGGSIEVYKYQGTWGTETSAQKAVKRATGGQPSSYVSSDGTFTAYNRADPLAMFIGIAADVRDVIVHGGAGANPDDVGIAAIIALASVFKDKTYTKGLADFVQALDEPERYWESYMNQKVGSFMPSLVNGFKSDDIVRQVRNPLDAIMNRTPVLSQTLEPKYDIFGQPKVASQGFMFKDTQFKHTDTARELFELAPNISRIAETQNGIDLTQYEMIDPETGKTISAFSRLNQIMASDKVGLMKKLERKINSRGYKVRKTSGIKTSEGVFGNTKEDEIQEIFSDAKAKALKQLERENPELKIEFRRMRDIIRKAGRSNSFDEAMRLYLENK